MQMAKAIGELARARKTDADLEARLRKDLLEEQKRMLDEAAAEASKDAGGTPPDGFDPATLNRVREILGILKKPESLISRVRDRPGHDRRYAIDHSRATAELGWVPTVSFSEGLGATVEWFLTHREWCDAVLAND